MIRAYRLSKLFSQLTFTFYQSFFTINFHFLLQGFSASYVIIDESEGRDYEYIDKTIPS